MVWRHGNDQFSRIITLEYFMIQSTLEMSLGSSSHVKLSISYMNELDNAVIMAVLSWKIKFSVNGRILSRKYSSKFYFENAYTANSKFSRRQIFSLKFKKWDTYYSLWEKKNRNQAKCFLFWENHVSLTMYLIEL